MIALDWLTDTLCDVLRWQLANPGNADHPDAPEVPIAGQRVWGIFLSLHAERGGGMGPAPIAAAGIDAWSRLHREPVRDFELEVLRALDMTYQKVMHSRDETAPPANAVNTRPMTPALFDALFAGR